MATRFHSPTPHWTHTLWFLDRTRYAWFVGLVLLYAAGFNGQWRNTPDSAVHVDAARVMIEGGDPYVDPQWIDRVQPGLSGVLAGVGWLSGSSAADGFGWPASLVMLGFAAATLALTYRLMILHADRPTAVLVVILLGTNHLFYELSFNLLTEVPFTLGFVLLLWGHERRLKCKAGLALSLSMMAAGLAVMAAFRSVAAMVVVGYLGAEVIRIAGRRDQRRTGAVLLGGGAAVAAGMWLLSSAVRDDTFLFINTLRQITGDRLLTNARELYNAILPEAVMGIAVPPPLSWLVTGSLAAAGLVLLRLRLLWAVLVAVFVVQWLVFLPDIRYVLPLLPVLIYGGWTLLIAGASRFPRRVGNFAFGFIGVCIVAANLVGIGFTIADQRRAAFYESYQHGRYLPARAMAQAIREESAEEAEVMVLTSSRAWAELAVWAERPVRPYVPADLGPSTTNFVVLPLSEPMRSQLLAAGATWGPALSQVPDPTGGDAWSLHRLQTPDPGSP